MPRIAEVAFPVPLLKGFHYLVPPGLDARPGHRVRAPFGPRRAVGVVVSVFEGEPERPLKTLDSLVDREPALDADLLALARSLSVDLAAPIGECVRGVLPSFVKALDEEIPADEFLPGAKPGVPALAARPRFELTAGQANALEIMRARLASRQAATVLLYGVPASGKTEVYLRLIRDAIADGGQALFLLPEISLTQPFFEEFSASLGAPVVLWHSRLGARARRRAWLGLRRGEISVVVGARSAALLPFPKLRLAVLDEEQDESFKQEGQAPLYHAREVALARCARAGALCVLGSATPSLEAWQMAKSGGAELVAMPDRVSTVARPRVECVASPREGAGCLSDELLEKIKQRLARREQSILLVNRRGFANFIMCRKCAWVDRCEDCGVAMIEHQSAQGFILRCHHCERKRPVPSKCGRCGGGPLRAAGVGTQKVVSELERALPGARVLRMDSDTLAKESRSDDKIYRQFLARKADILVGTKLVAKSFHFPDVTLVGVVDADTMLNMPDFRSSERTMQLLAQVSGRSGRAEKAGEVLLQTLHPEHLAIAKTMEGDYGAFADAELVARRELRYPPFASLVRLLWLGKNEPVAMEAADAACARLRLDLAQSGCDVVGPAPAVIKLVSGQHRVHALLKAPVASLAGALAAARACPLPSSVKLKINVDPYDLF